MTKRALRGPVDPELDQWRLIPKLQLTSLRRLPTSSLSLVPIVWMSFVMSYCNNDDLASPNPVEDGERKPLENEAPSPVFSHWVAIRRFCDSRDGARDFMSESRCA
jgi:hypothetical protein